MFQKCLKFPKKAKLLAISDVVSERFQPLHTIKRMKVDRATSIVLGETIAARATDGESGKGIDFELFQGIRLPYSRMFIQYDNVRYWTTRKAAGIATLDPETNPNRDEIWWNETFVAPVNDPNAPAAIKDVGALVTDQGDHIEMLFFGDRNDGQMSMPEIVFRYYPDTGALKSDPVPSALFVMHMGVDSYVKNLQHEKTTWGSDVMTVLQLITIINSTSKKVILKTDTPEKPFLYHGKIRKLPPSTTVSIDIGNKTPAKAARQFLTALRREKRRHDVRGHYRHYESGKVVWIKNHERGHGQKIGQEYEVTA